MQQIVLSPAPTLECAVARYIESRLRNNTFTSIHSRRTQYSRLGGGFSGVLYSSTHLPWIPLSVTQAPLIMHLPIRLDLNFAIFPILYPIPPESCLCHPRNILEVETGATSDGKVSGLVLHGSVPSLGESRGWVNMMETEVGYCRL